MGRGRKRTNTEFEWLPKYCSPGRSAIEYKPPAPAGQPRRVHRVCSKSASQREFHKAFAALLSSLEAEPTDTLEWLLHLYRDSPQFTHHRIDKPKSPKTIKEQSRQIDQICNYKLKSGKRFGQVQLKHIKQPVMRSYLDKRDADGAPVAGNREKSLISKAWNWAIERGHVKYANPCKGVVRNFEESDERYVEDWEYRLALKGCENFPSGHRYSLFIRLAYLCRLRKMEVAQLKTKDVRDTGLYARRLKRSKDTITAWTSELEAVIDDCRKLPIKAGVASAFLIHGPDGRPLNEEAINSFWARLMTWCLANGLETKFTIHQLKAKGYSDFEEGEGTGSKRDSAGHKSASMDAVYDRKPKVTKATK